MPQKEKLAGETGNEDTAHNCPGLCVSAQYSFPSERPTVSFEHSVMISCLVIQHMYLVHRSGRRMSRGSSQSACLLFSTAAGMLALQYLYVYPQPQLVPAHSAHQRTTSEGLRVQASYSFPPYRFSIMFKPANTANGWHLILSEVYRKQMFQLCQCSVALRVLLADRLHVH